MATVAVGLAWAARGSDARAEGPLAYEWATDTFGHFGEPGTDFSFGWAGLRNSGQEPAIVDAIKLGDGQGIELVAGYAVLQNDNPNAITDIPGFPPPGWEGVPLTPVGGFAVPPFDGVPNGMTDFMLLLHLAVADEAGAHSFLGITVDYHVGEVRYRITYPYGLRVCVPAEAYQHCGAPLSDDPIGADEPPMPISTNTPER